MQRLRLAVLLLALVPAVLGTLPALTAAQPAAKTPVALVLEVSGGRIAGVEPFREIAADTTVAVPEGVRFVFQHYGSCRRFTLVGGTVTLRADGVDVSGTRPTDTRVACPRKITLKSDGASAAVVMRSLGTPRATIASSRPTFVLVGPRATEFTAMRVKRGSELVLEQAFAGGPELRWPQTAAPLAAATNYEIELVPAAADRTPIVIGVRTLDVPTDDPMTLLSAE